MTLVDFHIVLPTGEPLANAVIEVQLSKSTFTNDVDGIAIPRLVTATTDAAGRAQLSLWPSTALYFAQVTDPSSDAGMYYKFLVPTVPAGMVVRLQNMVIDAPISETTYDEQAIAAINAAKVNAVAAAAQAMAAATEVQGIVDTIIPTLQPVVDAATNLLGIRDATISAAANAQSSKTDAQAAATAAASSQTWAAANAVVATTKAGEAATSASNAATSAAAAATAANSISTAVADVLSTKALVDTAATHVLSDMSSAQAAKTAAEAAATAAATSASQASAIAGGVFVTHFNGRSGEVSLSLADVVSALGFTPYNSTNPNNYITAAGNVATATRLQTARRINGVLFDGSSDISVEDSTKLALTGGVLSGTLRATGLFVGTNAVWHAGNFDPTSVSQFPGAAIAVSANTAMVANTLYHVDSTAAGFDMTLPANPAENSWSWIVDAANKCSSNPVIIKPNGKPISGATDDQAMDFNGDSFFAVFKAGQWVEQ